MSTLMPALSVREPSAGGQRPAAVARSAPAPEPPGFSVICVESVAELEEYVEAWDDLAAAAVEPNVFYESWMLLPALRAYGAGCNIAVVLIFTHRAPGASGKPVLCGLFPLARQRYRGLPVRVLSLWRYIHCYLAIPLLRAGFGRECLAAFFDWLATDRQGAALLECSCISADGPFYHLLLEHLDQQRREFAVMECYTRALLRPTPADQSPLAGLSGVKRKKLRRAEERLAASGAVTYLALPDDGDVEAWLADFLWLEASGWKQQQGTALACSYVDQQFFLDIASAAFERRRLMMLALHSGGRPLAQLCNFLAGSGSFAFKVAFDEAFARFSPGVLLELENMRQVQTRRIEWMDSCTERGDDLIKHLWADRRVMQTLLIETGRAPGALILGALPLLRWLRRRLRACLCWLRGRTDRRRGGH
jgi:CelD/BcsL family acetyltransferase involved in cellulose biosynthesis